MRIRTLFAGGLLALLVVVALPQAASATDPGTSEGQSLVTCVQKALKDNEAQIAKQAVHELHATTSTTATRLRASSPRRTTELIWGTIAFIIVALALIKYAFPAMRKGLQARDREDPTATSRRPSGPGGSRGAAPPVRGEARRGPRSRRPSIVEEARQDAERLRQELIDPRRRGGRRGAREGPGGHPAGQRTGRSASCAPGWPACRSTSPSRSSSATSTASTQLALVESYIDSVGASGNGHG